MKQILFFVAITLSLMSYSQISFEKGYYIDNNDRKKDCLIKNIDWLNNPTEFEYKVSENEESKIITIKSVKEFGIYNISKYIRSIVNIDRSSKNTSYLTNKREPIFNEEELFLKVLVEGKYNLYAYVDGGLNRYFYNTENSKIEQLIYKSYRSINNKIGENNRFRQQLWTDLKCSNFKKRKLERLNYKKNELINYFVEYHKCNNKDYINYQKKNEQDLFNLTLRPRLNSSSLEVNNVNAPRRDQEFGSKLGLGFGIEAEFILPFNKNKWAIAIEPTYQSFKSEDVTNTNPTSVNRVDYESIEIPFSLRHYLFLSENSKIFVNTSFILDIVMGDSRVNNLEISSRTNLAFGVGYKYNDRYSLEVRYQPKRDILNSYLYVFSEYRTLSMILGYSLF